MAWKNPETWTPDKPVTDVDFNRIEENLRVLEASSRELPVTAGSANAYTATIQDLIGLVAGRKITVKFHTAGTGASTLNVNSLGAKSITKPGGGNPNLKAGGIYNLVYDGTSFQLLGEGGDLGTATPDKVLKPYTVVTENGLEEGTIVDRRNYNGSEQYSPSLVDIIQHSDATSAIIKVKPTFTGYMDDTTTIQQNILNLNPNTIKDGVKVGNATKFITGTFTSDANAVAAYMLTGNSAYAKGLKVNGSMADRGSPQITLTNQGDQYNLSSGYYTGGFVKVLLANLTADVIKEGVKVGNITGTLKVPTVGTNPAQAIAVSNTNKETTSSAWTKLKEMRIPTDVTGVAKVVFNYTPVRDSGSASGNLYVAVYINGVIVGAQVMGGPWDNQQQLVREVSVKSNDLIQIYGRVVGSEFRLRIGQFWVEYYYAVAPVPVITLQ